MGMAAGQARLLSITARLTDNENNGQAISYAKQRLTDQADQINAEYNAALDATKLQVLTGFNGTQPIYSDISYNLMTGYNTNSFGKQYIVTNAKNQVLVTQKLAAAFEAGNGDYNTFLNKLGYSQVDVNFAPMTEAEKQQTVHEAWDAYMKSIGRSFYSEDHDTANPHIEFGYVNAPAATAENKNPVGHAYYVDTDHSYFDIPTASFACINTSMNVKNKDKMIDDGNYIVLRGVTNTLQIISYDYNAGAVCPSSSTPGKYCQVKYNSETGQYEEGKIITDSRFDENLIGEFYEFTDNNGVVYTLTRPKRTDYTSTELREDIYYNLHVRDEAMSSSSSGCFRAANGGVASGVPCYMVFDSGRNSVATLANTKPKNVAINYEGNNAEQRALYDYAVAITREAFGDKPKTKDGNDVANIVDNAENANLIKYYKNIFNAMLTYGYYTEQNENDTINQTADYKLPNNYESSVCWFEQQLKEGKLLLRYYSKQEDGFVSTTISDDGAIQEVKDERAIALIEAKHTQDTEALERKDKKYDLELKKLDTEHSALQTEYESLKSTVDKNIEKSFNMFS